MQAKAIPRNHRLAPNTMIRTFALLLPLLLASTAASADESKWQAFLVAGESALSKKEFTEAEKLFRAALREASAFEKTDERRGITLNHLATTLNAQRHYGHAEPVLLQAMAIWDEMPPSNELHLATTLHHLAGIHHARGEYETAAKALVHALEIRERSLPADHAALRHTRKSITTLGAVLGKDHYILQAGRPPAKQAKATKAVVKAEPTKRAPVKLAMVKPAAPEKARAPAQTAAKPGKVRTASKAQTAGQSAGRFVLHLASFKTVEAANQAWSRLQSTYQELLGNLALTLQPADLGDQGTFQRILAGPVTQKTAARDLCKRLKGKGQYCAVVPSPS